MRRYAVACFVLFLVSHSALAVDEGTAALAEIQDTEAKALFNERRFAEAAQHFLRAFALVPESRYLFNAARAYEIAGQLERSLPLYERYVGLEPVPLDAEAARSTAEVLRGALRKTHGLVRVSTRPEGAMVTADGDPEAHVTPFTLWLPAGAHRLELELDGYGPERRTVMVNVGGDEGIVVDLAARRQYGRLDVRANVEGATVYLDNRVVGVTPLEVEEVESGAHTVRVEAPGHEPVVSVIQVSAAGRATVDARLTAAAMGAVETGPAWSAYGWAATGTSIAFLVAGAVMHAFAFDASSEASSLQPASTSYSNDFDALAERGQLLEVLAYSSYGLGAAALGVGVWLLVDPPEVNDGGGVTANPVSLSPLVLPGGAGLWLSAPF